MEGWFGIGIVFDCGVDVFVFGGVIDCHGHGEAVLGEFSGVFAIGVWFEDWGGGCVFASVEGIVIALDEEGWLLLALVGSVIVIGVEVLFNDNGIIVVTRVGKFCLALVNCKGSLLVDVCLATRLLLLLCGIWVETEGGYLLEAWSVK